MYVARTRVSLSSVGETLGVIIGDTDGLAVTSKPIGEAFPAGLLVVQDGLIRDENGKRRNQRFAYVSWSDIEAALGL